MDFNPDELVAPKWIDNDFLKNALECKGKFKDVKIINFETEPGSNLNDHFASVMFRAKVNFTTGSNPNQSISLIMKTFPEVEGFKKDTLSKLDFFETETFMYENVLNDCQQILSKNGLNEQIAPSVYFTSLEPHKVLVFEDLKELGYYVLPKKIPNENEAMIILSKLARFHAVTFKMLADGRKDLYFRRTLFALSHLKKMSFFSNSLTLLAETLDTLPEFKTLANRIHKMEYDEVSQNCMAIVSQPGSYNVLNHGDYHLRNMMFKNNEMGIPADMMMVDFQIPHYGSPAYDLLYATTAFSKKLKDGLIKHYFKVFVDVLAKIGYDGNVPTYEQLINDLKSYALVELFLLSCIGPFVIVKWSELPDNIVENVMQDPNAAKMFFRSPDYKSLIKDRLPALFEGLNVEAIN